MAKFTDYEVNKDIEEIMEKIIEAHPTVFQGFDVNQVQGVFTKGKKGRKPIKLIPVKYPYDVIIDKAYIVEVMKDQWDTMGADNKGRWVFHIMCSIPEGGFDAESNNYGKKRRYDYELYAEEYAVTGGVPNWWENPAAKSPFEKSTDAEEAAEARKAVTPSTIAAATASTTPAPKKRGRKANAATAAAPQAAQTATAVADDDESEGEEDKE